MLNRDDFNAKLEATIGKYPELAARRQAGDPALTQHLDAVFTAFAMLSANQELALAEPHAKTRPATVLADAALRGIIAKATPAVVMVRVRNESPSSYSIAEGRTILDTAGRPYRAAYAVTVPGDSEQVVKFVQSRAEVVIHNIVTPAEFYATGLPTPDDDSELSAIRVFHTNGNEMVYKQDYVGVEPGEFAYHVEVNAEKTVFVRFGDGESVGYMVQAGDAFRIEADYCAGEVSLEVQEPFEFEYTATPRDVTIALELDSVEYKGASAQSIDALRELCKYPAIYDDDAVFLGEFDYLLNKHFSSADFLSVWNEAIEEKHRGYDLVNTNSLFVACVDSGGSEVTVGESETYESVRIISEGEWTPFQRAIADRVKRADDTLRTRFYTPKLESIPVEVIAQIPSSYTPGDVEQAIRELLIKNYGKTSAFAQAGGVIKTREAMEQLVDGIPALRAQSADVSVKISAPEGAGAPEVWRFVSESSIDVSLTVATGRRSGW